ncbi:MAG TPA: metallophosphoesterase family protein [Vicinamibacterales bacterium]|jgi:diadenosine tetraphosphatase ApaH/serine/threonine PP2A family protein phosphatase
MRYLVLTDIHANLEALDACVAFALTRRFDATLVLGDLVGYGPDPNEVIAHILDLKPTAIVRGNHDKVASGIDQAEGFNIVAKIAAVWTLETLTPANREWLAALPVGPTVVNDLIEICHGSPFDEDAYVVDELDALRALRAAERPLCLFGHTHWPVTFVWKADDSLDAVDASHSGESRLALEAGARYLMNPGSVGQPRDGDSRAAFAIVDDEQRSVELYRLAYPVERTQTKIIRAGLPEVLASRLAAGR